MQAGLLCINPQCAARYAVTDVIYECPACAGLLEVDYTGDPGPPQHLKRLFRERRMSNDAIEQSGVWRYRELFPFLDSAASIVTLREGNTPLLPAARAAAYCGVDRLQFKHQGFNPTGSFKDNGMTAGASQAKRLGLRRVACVSTGNTSASMAAYAAAAGLDPIVFIPNGNIAFGKLGQALDYGAKTFQVDANFDQILALVRLLAQRLGIYLLNSVNPFRIEGQKSIVIEMMDQMDWQPPDWIVLPGGNLGNISALGKALRELRRWGFIDREPRLAVVQAAGARPFFEYMNQGGPFTANHHPETLATAIKIGDPVSWPKAENEIRRTKGVVLSATEQEIADAKAVIGACGFGCEPASAASLAGIRSLQERGDIRRGESVVGILTGNVLKDPDYIYRYHTGQLEGPDGKAIASTFGNKPIVVPNNADEISRLLSLSAAERVLLQ